MIVSIVLPVVLFQYFGLVYAAIGTTMFLILVMFCFLVNEIQISNKLQQELNIQKEHFGITLNSISEALITTGTKGEILYMNPVAEKLTGWKNTEAKYLPLETIYDVVNEESGDPFENIVSRILKTKQAVEFENNTILRTKDQKSLVISNSGSPLFDSKGDLWGTVLLFNDISYKNKIEDKLKLTEEKYRNLVEQAADGIFIFDQQSNFMSAYPIGCRSLGYTKEEVLKMSLKDITPEKYLSKPLNLAELNSGIPYLVERQFVRKDGTVIFTEVQVQLTSTGNIQAIVRDITDRKNAEIKTLKAIKQYDILSRATSDTIWDWDIVHNKVSYNGNISKMFGYEITEVENVPEWWQQKIHPDDLESVSESVDEVFAKQLTHLQLEYRFRCDDGSYKYIYDRAYVIYDEQHKPLRMIGAMQDVSYKREEEKRIAKAIIDAQEKERLYIGQELHDNVNQILAGSLLTLSMAKEKQTDVENILGYIQVSKGHILHAINEVRKLSHELAPASFDDLSLENIFSTLLTGINVNNQYTINLHFDPIINVAVSDNIQINLYRILQEQVKNILNYSAATTIDVTVTFADNIVKMRTADNGTGFDTKKIKGGIGINNIKKRVEALAGKLILHGAPGKGCEMIIEIPCEDLMIN